MAITDAQLQQIQNEADTLVAQIADIIRKETSAFQSVVCGSASAQQQLDAALALKQQDKSEKESLANQISALLNPLANEKGSAVLSTFNYVKGKIDEASAYKTERDAVQKEKEACVAETNAKGPTPSANTANAATTTTSTAPTTTSNAASATTTATQNGSATVNAKVPVAQSAAAQSEAFNLAQKGDWRVRLALAPAADYLYKDPSNALLAPLRATEGVIFPYTPSISVSYQATYGSESVTHSNYKVFQYQNSAIESINITADFTAQDTFEAQYVLAVIHFLRSCTKMFYGKDSNPKAGTPPPLVYLYGMGDFQFNGQPMVINSFNYTLPTDVDYIRTQQGQVNAVNLSSSGGKGGGTLSAKRLGSGVVAGGANAAPNFGNAGSAKPTYVPTKIQLTFSAYPVVSRNRVSNDFSLKEYANGNLLLNKNGAFW